MPRGSDGSRLPHPQLRSPYRTGALTVIQRKQLYTKDHLAAAGAFSWGSSNAQRPPREENRCNQHPNSVFFFCLLISCLMANPTKSQKASTDSGGEGCLWICKEDSPAYSKMVRRVHQGPKCQRFDPQGGCCYELIELKGETQEEGGRQLEKMPLEFCVEFCICI